MDKFKEYEELITAYANLEREFTRKSQQVKEYERMAEINDSKVYAKALDIMAFNLVCATAGLKTKEEKRAKKEEYKKLALDVAQLMLGVENGDAEFKEVR